MNSHYAIIFIAGRIPNGAFPRLPGFSYNEEFQKYMYGGRPLTPDEFNEIAETILDVPEKRYSLSVRLVPAAEVKAHQSQAATHRQAVATATADTPPPEEPPVAANAPEGSAVPASDEPTQEPPAPEPKPATGKGKKGK